MPQRHDRPDLRVRHEGRVEDREKVVVHELEAGAVLDVHVRVQELLHPLVLGLVVADGEHETLGVQLALYLCRLCARSTGRAAEGIKAGSEIGGPFVAAAIVAALTQAIWHNKNEITYRVDV